MTLPRKPKKEWKPSLNHPEPPTKKEKTKPEFKEWQKQDRKRRHAFKRKSEKQEGLLALYKAEKKRRGIGPFPCLVCGKPVIIGQNGSWHHTKGRRTPEAIVEIEPAHEVPCHRKIHSRPGWALRMGFLFPEFFRSVK